MLRARDVMQEQFPVTRHDEPIREAGPSDVHADLELVPIVDDDGALAGVLTERALARRYIRDSRRTSTLEEAPTWSRRSSSVLEGELVAGEDRHAVGPGLGVRDGPDSDSGISDGDIVVVGNRPEALLRVIELGAGARDPLQSAPVADDGAGGGRRARHRARRLAAGQLRLGPDGDAGGALPAR